MKILFIDPYGWQGAASGNRAYPNIGIAYLSAALKKRGHEVFFIDLNNILIAEHDILDQITNIAPTVICFSVKTATFRHAKELALKVKQANPTIKIAFGGPHITLYWDELQGDSFADLLFVGEGEHELAGALEQLVAETPSQTSPRIHMAGTERINAVDSLEFPDYTIFSDAVKETLKSGYPLISSRGCPYQCIYCSVPKITGSKNRQRSPQNVISELKQAIQNYGITGFEVIDDSWNINMERCKTMCRMLIEEKLNLNWTCPNGIRADRIDEELAMLMFQSGCRSANVGVESGSEFVFQNIKKGTTLDKIETGIKHLQKAGISVSGFFIIGLPGDNPSHVQESLDFVKRNIIGCHFNMLVPYPKTEVYEWVKQHGTFLKADDYLHFTTDLKKLNPVFETKGFSAFAMKKAYIHAHLEANNLSLIMPPHLSPLAYKWQYLKILLYADPVQIPSFLFKSIIKFLRRILSYCL